MGVSVLGGLAFFCYRVGPVENLGPGMRPGRGLEPVRPRRYMFMRTKIIFVHQDAARKPFLGGVARKLFSCCARKQTSSSCTSSCHSFSYCTKIETIFVQRARKRAHFRAGLRQRLSRIWCMFMSEGAFSCTRKLSSCA